MSQHLPHTLAWLRRGAAAVDEADEHVIADGGEPLTAEAYALELADELGLTPEALWEIATAAGVPLVYELRRGGPTALRPGDTVWGDP